MFYVRKAGKSDYGIWLIGDLKTDTVELNGIFSTNLTDLPVTDKLEVNRLKISKNPKNNTIKFHLEIL